MINRCESNTDVGFKKYGGRGISVCERWRKSFENFLADMGVKPSAEYSIDRKDNDGNYEPGNCRWASVSVQQFNKRVPKNNSSGVRGARFHKDSGRWLACIGVQGRRIHLGLFDSFEEACAARKAAELKYHGFNPQ